MYVPEWPPMSPALWLPSRGRAALPFPFSAKRRVYGFRARNLIHNLLRTLGFGPSDHVLVPDYHHGSEVAAIRAAGASVDYYPIRSDLTPDMGMLRCKLERRPRALLLTHYLGWAQPVEEVKRMCRERGVLLIEDCALSLLSHATGGPLGSFGDYAVFCLYKTLPVPNGALLVANDPDLPLPDSRASGEASRLGAMSRSLELSFEWMRARNGAVGRSLEVCRSGAASMLKLFGARALPLGDDGFDPRTVDARMSGITSSLIPKFDCTAIRHRRRENFRRLRNAIPQPLMLRPNLGRGVCPLFMPLVVEDKHQAALALRRHGIGAVEFWNHETAGTPTGPGARFLRRHVLEIPLHQDVTDEQLDRMADRVRLLSPKPRAADVRKRASA